MTADTQILTTLDIDWSDDLPPLPAHLRRTPAILRQIAALIGYQE